MLKQSVSHDHGCERVFKQKKKFCVTAKAFAVFVLSFIIIQI